MALETNSGEVYTPIPSPGKVGGLVDFSTKLTPPKPMGRAGTWDVLWYRLRQGFQNSMLSNVIDAASLIGEDDPNMARYSLRQEKANDLYQANPAAAQAVESGKDGGILGTIAEGVGTFGADPTLLLPFGAVGAAGRAAGIGAKAAVGGTLAGIGATANIAHQYVQSPDIEAKQVAIAGALGGVLGYAITPVGRGSQNLAPQVAEQIAQAPHINPGVVNEALETAGVHATPQEIQAATDSTMAARSGTSAALQAKLAAAGRAADKEVKEVEALSRLADDPKLVDFSNRVAMEEGWEAVTSAYQSAPPGVQGQLLKKIQKLRRTQKEGLKTQEAVERYYTQTEQQQRLLKYIETDLAYTQREYSTAREYAKSTEGQFKRAADQRAGLLTDLRDTSPPLDNALQQSLKDAGLAGRGWTIPGSTIEGALPSPRPGVTYNSEVTEALVSRSYFKLKGGDVTKQVTLKELQKELKGIPEDVITSTVQGMRAQGTVMLQTHGDDLALHMDAPLHEQVFDRAVEGLARQNHFNLSTLSANPFFNPMFLKNPRVAGAAIGGVIGFTQAENQEQGFLFGALAGGLTPWIWGRTVGRASDIFAANNPELVGEAVGKHWQDLNLIYNPLRKIKAMGPAGEELVAKMENATDNINFRVADVLTNYQKAIGKNAQGHANKLTTQDELNVANLIEGKPTTGPIPTYVRNAAESLRHAFKNIGDEAFTTGIWAERKATPHYYPRIMDEAYLSTKEGKERFVNRLMAMDWTEESAEKTITALLGNKAMAKRYVQLMTKSGDKVIIDRGMAHDLLLRRGQLVGKRSTHLEHQRTVDVGQLDHLLDEFRIREPGRILDRYLYDTFTRIEHAKLFGAKDEKALELFARIQDDLMDVKAAEVAKNQYYTQAGDALKSDILKGYHNAPQWLKVLNGKVAAFETLKLIYSQILQPTQAFVNGTTQMSKVLGITDSFKNTFTTLLQTIKNDPLHDEFVQRAAAGINVGLIEHLTEATSEAALFGHGNLAQKFKWINSPSAFLKATGFMKMEKFTQRWATLQGHAYMENLLDKAAKIQQGAITDTKLIGRVREGLEELGVDWEKALRGTQSPEGVTVRDKMLGAMRFNRIVNFTDGARQLPQLWRSPEATMFRMFKTFAYRQGDFITNTVIAEARKGNLTPLVTYMLAAAPAGLAVDQIRKFIKADDRDYTNSEDLLRVLSTAGGIGYINELLLSGLSNEYQFKNMLMGPGPSDILRVAGTADSLVKGDWRPLGKAVARSLPDVPPFGLKKDLIEELGIADKKKRSKKTARPYGLDFGLGLTPQ